MPLHLDRKKYHGGLSYVMCGGNAIITFPQQEKSIWYGKVPVLN
jgi:hypothetical protein